jgi:hypothetical protein
VRVSRPLAVVACVLVVALGPHARASAPDGRVVVVTLPGFDWDAFDHAKTPSLHALIDDGAVAAVSVRSVVTGSTPVRGYLTLGAGGRAYADAMAQPRRDEPPEQVALPASAPFENGTAGEAMARRVAHPRSGAIVAPDVPSLDELGKQYSYGTRVGALGEELARRGLTRAVVAAADVAATPRTADMRRGAVLSIVDGSGTVDIGQVDALLAPDPAAPFGVRTDVTRFTSAVARALSGARVIVVEPGETLRADEFALDATQDEARLQRTHALERADELIGRVAALLSSRDVLYVVGVSSPLVDTDDHLTLAVAHGAGIGRGWLTSPTTHRASLVTLTDVAPTLLAHIGIATPDRMSGTPMRSVASSAPDRLATLHALDIEAQFGDVFQGVFAKMLVLILALALVALGGVLVARLRLVRLVVWLSFAALTVPPAAYVVRLAGVDRLGIVGATIASIVLVAAVATLAHAAGATAWKTALVGVAVSFAITTADLLAGAPLQLNNVFGYSPISAGRFYGNSNIEYAVLTATALIGVFAILELRAARRIPLWAPAALCAVVVIEGLPQFGADFGGVIASVPAIAVAYAAASRRAVRVRRVLVWGASGAVAAAGAMLVDAARPANVRTHLGRFAGRVLSGGAPDAFALVQRKAQSNIGLLGSAWIWTVPVAIAAYALLRWKSPEQLDATIRDRRMVCAGVAGTLVAGVLGFAVNDTGIWVLGMMLAYAVPFFVLLVVEKLDEPRTR